MKIIKPAEIVTASGQAAVDLFPDSAIQRSGKPFFVPDFASRFAFRIFAAVHVCRLGKNIALKFARRYYDAVCLCLVTEAVDLLEQFQAAGAPYALATAFDGAVVTGECFPFAALGQEPLSVGVRIVGPDGTERSLEAEADLVAADRLIEHVSRFFTLKIGDCILIDLGMPRTDMIIGSRVTATISGNESVNVKIK